ncbi:S100 calcium-binding protein, ventral prostate like isoform X1 [Mus musculus]|nr:S100 calcium-binding protein, ventral prostate like isoform X1 [Mus musculus]XP_011238391.1 S100 calcium-binding protein, ventral prostate like isoform X1 [Mus musculus]|eukprot:XP_011238390.1 PREDICTED: S100 calcium-binding protein, ventral prostate like isoform X1 [Mus musculus]
MIGNVWKEKLKLALYPHVAVFKIFYQSNKKYKMDQGLTPSEHKIMMLYRNFTNYALGTTVILGEKEFRKLVRSEFPNFLQEVQETPLSILLDEPKDRSFEEALNVIGRMGMVYYKKMNNNAFER